MFYLERICRSRAEDAPPCLLLAGTKSATAPSASLASTRAFTYIGDLTVKVPIEIAGSIAFTMKYQHDLILKEGELVKAIGSVKTSSKDSLAHYCQRL